VQTLIEIDTCHCLMVSEPERLAHSPSTRPRDRLGCAAYRPSAPVAVCAGCGQLAVLAAVAARAGTGYTNPPRPRLTGPPAHLRSPALHQRVGGVAGADRRHCAVGPRAARGACRCRLRTVAGHWPTARPVQVRRTIQCSGHRIVRSAGGVDPVARAARAVAAADRDMALGVRVTAHVAGLYVWMTGAV
jgi:hypothetical protein